MSETRYSPEDFEAAILEGPHAVVPDMLKQAASDARVLAQLWEWLEDVVDIRHAVSDGYARGVRDALAELDRLTRPAQEAEK